MVQPLYAHATKHEKSSMRADTADRDRPLVYIADDDSDVRLAIEELMHSVGIEAVGFASARELLDVALDERPGCLVLDVRMPGISGLELQRHLASHGNPKPIVFLTGHGDIAMTVEAMKAGAVDFLTKPVRDQTLIDAVRQGIEIDIANRAAEEVTQINADRFATLTPRERQVLREVAAGRVNKQIAFDLGISEATVKLHRGNAMRKMGASSVASLIRAWESLPPQFRDDAAA